MAFLRSLPFSSQVIQCRRVCCQYADQEKKVKNGFTSVFIYYLFSILVSLGGCMDFSDKEAKEKRCCVEDYIHQGSKGVIVSLLGRTPVEEHLPPHITFLESRGAVIH